VSPACRRQIEATGHCRRVSLDEIAMAVREVRRVSERHGIDLLVLNLDFVATDAVQGTRRAVARDGTAFVDLVERIGASRRARQNRLAQRLGLAPARAPIAPQPNAADATKPRTVLLRVLAPFAGTYGVRGQVEFRPETTFVEPLYDDGSHGDEIAGDRVYSGTVTVDANAKVLFYKYWLEDTPELMGLPPLGSTYGQRDLRLTEHEIGPVDRFGRPLFKAEGAHPNGEGHKVVAKTVARRIEATPSFRRYRAASSGPSQRYSARPASSTVLPFARR
jgi:hypothetical protein